MSSKFPKCGNLFASTYYIPLRGQQSPYAQSKHLPKSEEKFTMQKTQAAPKNPCRAQLAGHHPMQSDVTTDA